MLLLTRALILLSLLSPPVLGAITLPDIFADHMVLQRETELPVWGTASPGERITVTIGGQRRSASADEKGRWRVRLAPMPAGGPLTMTVAGRSAVVFSDILVGEVWIGSGQSNMVWRVGRSKDSEKEIAAADFPEIRIAHKPCVKKDLINCTFPKNEWIPVRPGTIRSLSAESYFFARELHRELKVPVGMIVRAVGGTPALYWVGSRAVAEPGGLDPERLLIRTWRRTWGQRDFPFLFMQYPKGGGWNPQNSLHRLPQKYRPDEWGLISLEHVRESLALPNVWMDITLDLERGTHPLDKQSYAGRLAKLALAKVYGRDKEFRWADARIDGDTVLVSHPKISRPVHIRYGWAHLPNWCNLFNKAGFPAMPFRSDQ